MRVGLISDTHGLLRPEALGALEGVDVILHAGDVGNPDILTQLAVLAPVHAVYGNTDGFELRDRLPPQQELELGGWKVLITHGHELGSPKPVLLRRYYPAADIIVYGHTHNALVEEVAGGLIVNPGAAGPARFSARPSVAVLELGPGRRDVQLIEL